MLRTNLMLAMLFASVAGAQTQSATTPVSSDASAPALVSTVAPQTNDSPLVQAAKRSVAARQKVTVKIDNASVRNSTKLLTTTDTPRTIPVLPPLPTAQPQRAASTSADRAAAQKKSEAAKPPVRPPMDDAESLYETGEEVPPETPSPQKAAKPQAPKPRP